MSRLVCGQLRLLAISGVESAAGGIGSVLLPVAPVAGASVPVVEDVVPAGAA